VPGGGAVGGAGAAGKITAAHVTDVLRSCLSDTVLTDDGPRTLATVLNFAAKDISARALRAGGCMALFRSNLDDTRMHQFGRWRSWAMNIYLHRTATDTSQYAAQMLANGSFTLTRHNPLPVEVAPEINGLLAAAAA